LRFLPLALLLISTAAMPIAATPIPMYIIVLLGFVIAYLGNNDVDLKSLGKTIDDFISGKKKK